MKLVETDRHGPPGVDDGSETITPPRPEHRRVSISLVLTALVLVGTVATVYLVFPERHNLLMTRALEAHREVPEFQLERPSEAELKAWSIALLDRRVPWPSLDQGLEVIGAGSLSVLNRRAALARYRVSTDDITLVVQAAREVPPRKHRRINGDEYVVSWRKGRWTFVAVGPAGTVDNWKSRLGAP